MSSTHKIKTIVTADGRATSRETEITSEYTGNLPALNCPVNATTEITFAAPIASIKDVLIFATGNLVLRTNSNTAPDDEFVLTADNYLAWNEKNLAPIPFDVDITKLYAVNGQAQVETATVAGTIGAAGAGNVSVVVTAAGMAGSPLTVPVAVANDDTAAQVAGKIRTALGLVAAITALFTVGGSSTTVTLTRLIGAANDDTLNIATSTGTATGLTAAPTSANTTPGIVNGGTVALTVLALLDVTP